MEVIEKNTTPEKNVQALDLEQLSKVYQPPASSSIYAPGCGVLQHIYNFSTGQLAALSLRRTRGLCVQSALAELVWLKSVDMYGEAIFVGVESEYVYERTGMLLTARLAEQANDTTLPLFTVIQAVLFELEPILGFEVQQILPYAGLPAAFCNSIPKDSLALDHHGSCKILFLSDKECLDRMESEARNYCHDFLEQQRAWSLRIKTPVFTGFTPLKRFWSPAEINEIDLGDLLALKGAPQRTPGHLLQGFCRIRRLGVQHIKYQVNYNMSEEDMSLEFAVQASEDTPKSIEMDVPLHEQIELDILVGHTSIPLSELCAVQAGTLIELGQHNLPMVTVCANGEPILEGELVHFQDQLMVQVTKRLV